MPDVSIEQLWESRQTFFRVKGVGRLLDTGLIRIRQLDTNEMLGPEGWKKQVLSNLVGQTLDGDDLLLEISAKLINHIDTGRAIELQVDELQLREEILPGELHPYPTSKAVQAAPPVHKFEQARRIEAPDTPPIVPVLIVKPDQPPETPPDVDESKTVLVTDGPPPERDDKTQVAEITEPADPNDRQLEPDDRQRQPDNRQREPEDRQLWADDMVDIVRDNKSRGGRVLIPVAAALLVGCVIGFFSKPIYDEYFPSTPVGGTLTANQVGVLEAAAFGPLSTTLRELADKSPAGTQPERIALRTNPDRARLFFNEGAKKAPQDKSEAIYWY